MKQTTFESLAWSGKGKVTRRERFLAEMDAVIPWRELHKLYDSESMRRFAGIELAEDAVPDESTILRFRRVLELHQLSEKIFGKIRALLEDKRLLLKSGTIVDATIIEAPTSTKNADGERKRPAHP
jgi:transposase, IS5 family